ncbi:MAG: hypothetical protein WBP14_03800 [Candidatus Saccharimonas aalborgensis]
MFFKKKSPSNHAFDTATLFAQIGAELYEGIGLADGSSTVTALLEFDEQQRVSNIKNPLVDGTPKIPPFETIEAINNLAAPLASLPENQRVRALEIEIENGQVNINAKYLHD